MTGNARRGGARAGAGRPAGSGKYGEPTRSLRVPLSRIDAVRALLVSGEGSGDATDHPLPEPILRPASQPEPLARPLYAHRIPAGFPSPAENDVEQTLDLNRLLVRNRDATFFLRVDGDSMLGAGIHDGDLLVIDRSLPAQPGRIVIAVLDGALTVKRLEKRGARLFLLPENPAFAEIEVGEAQELMIWGVVTQVIHAL